MGSKSQVPAAPDYFGLANQQSKANTQTAETQSRLSNPNIVSPYGTQTVQYGVPTFDQAGYDQALSAYQSGTPTQTFDQAGFTNAQNDYNQRLKNPFTLQDFQQHAQATGQSSPTAAQEEYQQYLSGSLGTPQEVSSRWGFQMPTAPNASQFQTTGTPGQAPSRDQFMIQSDPNTPTVTQTLSPEAQNSVSKQMQVQSGLADTAQSALGRAQGVMGTPFQFQGPDVQTSLGDFGAIQNTVGDAGAINQGPTADQYGLAGGGPSAGQYGTAAGIAGNAYGQAGGGPSAGQYGLAGGGPSPGQYGTAGGGPSARQYGTAGGVGAGDFGMANRNLDLSGVASMPINAGMTGQNAIMSRLDPQLQREQAAYETQLRNQGLVPGGEAYNNAMAVQNQRQNDLKTQAALYGINLDLAANQQGYGQALSSGQFGNQAVAQNFGQGLQSQAQKNAAISQMFGQGQNAQILQNAAVGQNFGQGQSAQAMQNQAIGQNFGQGQSAQAMQNQAVGQNFGQGFQGQQLTNQAIGQNFGQGQAAQQMQNAAIGQNLGQSLAAQQAQNAAQQQQYGQNLNNAQFQNQAQNQGYNQGLQSAQFGNTAQQQALQQQLYQRNLPLNEISALMSGSQIQNPQFMQYQGSNIAPPNLIGAGQSQYNAGLQGYGMQNNSQNAYNTGLMGLAGTAAATSSQWGPYLMAAMAA